MTVLACDPDQLRTTARDLRRAADELEVSAAEIAGSSDPVWTGLAAVEQAARLAEVSGAVRQLASPLEQVAGALVVVASAAQEHGATVRWHSRLRDEAELERSRLVAFGSPTEPVGAASWSAQVARLGEEVAGHRRLVDEAERAFAEVLGGAARLLEQIRAQVPQIVWDLVLTVTTARNVARGWRQATGAAGLAGSARRLRRMRVPGGERTHHVVQQRVDKHVRRLRMQTPAWVAKVPGGAKVAGRALPVVALLDAAGGAWTGGGYEGWRGGLTRGLAVAGTVGAGVAVVTGGVVVGVAAAPAAVAGLGLAAVYQAWMTGNWVYDNRERVGRLASRAWSGTRSFGGRVWSGGKNVVGTARERAASGLGRLRERLGLRDGARPLETSSRPRSSDQGLVVAPGPAAAGAHA